LTQKYQFNVPLAARVLLGQILERALKLVNSTLNGDLHDYEREAFGHGSGICGLTVWFNKNFSVSDADSFMIAPSGSVGSEEAQQRFKGFLANACVVRHLIFNNAGEKSPGDYEFVVNVALDHVVKRDWYGMIYILSARSGDGSMPYDSIEIDLIEEETPRIEIRYDPERTTNRELYESLIEHLKTDKLFTPGDPSYQHPQ
jgi:hypothetical protein